MTSLARKFLKLYPDIFRINSDGLLFCIKCRTVVNSSRKFLIVQHLKTLKHQNSNFKSPSPQGSLHEEEHVANVGKEQFQDLITRAFIAAKIPLFKLNEPNFTMTFRNFNLDYKNVEVNSSMIDGIIGQRIQNLRPKISGCDVFITIVRYDFEAMEFLLFFITDLLWPGKSYIFEVLPVSENMNYETAIVRTINNSIFKMNINSENIILLMTEFDENMLKTGRYLKILYPKLHHITCIGDLINSISVKIRNYFENLKQIIYRKDNSSEDLIRWFDTIKMYSDNLSNIGIFKGHSHLQDDIRIINRNYMQFKILIQAMQSQTITVMEAISILDKIEIFEDPANIKEVIKTSLEVDTDLYKIFKQQNSDVNQVQYKLLESCQATLLSFHAKKKEIQISLSTNQSISSDDIRIFLIQFFSTDC